MIGKVFGKWTVLRFSHVDKSRQNLFVCRCECGTEKAVRKGELVNGRSVRCKRCSDIARRIYKPIEIGGKYGKWTVLSICKEDPSFVIARCECEKNYTVNKKSICYGSSRKCASCKGRDANLRHGHNCRGKITPEYRAWHNMKTRCLNPNCKEWKYYGGRGIKIYNKWINSFEAFLDYMGSLPSREYSLERLDSNGHYEPGNVLWGLRKKQSLNRRMMYEYKGQKISLSSISKKYKIRCQTIKTLLYSADYTLEDIEKYAQLSHYKRIKMGILLRKGIIVSVEELRKEPSPPRNERHPLYHIWRGLMQRCNNSKHRDYHNYGGRGIRVEASLCTFKGFLSFVQEVLGPKHMPSSQLDRIDVDRDYEPGNLRWIDPEHQAVNKRSALKIDGKRISSLKLSDKFGLSIISTRILIKMGYNEEGLMWYAGLTFREKRELGILTNKLSQYEAMEKISEK